MTATGLGVLALVLAASGSKKAEDDTPVVALTFDDATERPGVNGAILKALADAQVRSVLFVAGQNVDSPAGLAQVRRWGEAGH